MSTSRQYLSRIAVETGIGKSYAHNMPKGISKVSEWHSTMWKVLLFEMPLLMLLLVFLEWKLRILPEHFMIMFSIGYALFRFGRITLRLHVAGILGYSVRDWLPKQYQEDHGILADINGYAGVIAGSLMMLWALYSLVLYWM